MDLEKLRDATGVTVKNRRPPSRAAEAIAAMRRSDMEHREFKIANDVRQLRKLVAIEEARQRLEEDPDPEFLERWRMRLERTEKFWHELLIEMEASETVTYDDELGLDDPS